MRSFRMILPGVLLLLLSSGAWALPTGKATWRPDGGGTNDAPTGIVVGAVSVTGTDAGNNLTYHIIGTLDAGGVITTGTLDLPPNSVTTGEAIILAAALAQNDNNNFAVVDHGKVKKVGTDSRNVNRKAPKQGRGRNG